ncbi:MAG: hypothetical protein GY954_10705 [Alteromonas sp.]|nr:hypothetical protein [Alteromonas sp.]
MATDRERLEELRALKAESEDPRDRLAQLRNAQTEANTPKQQDEPVNILEGIAQSGLQGATLGFGDEIQALIAAAVASPYITDQTFSQIMVDARKSLREDQAQFKQEHPKTALVSEIAGGAMTGGVGLAKTAAAKTLGQTVAKGAGAGAGIGAVAGVGGADQDNFFSSHTVQEGIEGAISGAAFGGSFPLMAKALVKSGKMIPTEAPQKMLESALKFKPSLPAKDRARAVTTALNEGIMPTVKGLEVIAKKIQGLDVGLNKIIDTATDKGVLISKKSLFTELKKLRRDLGGVKIDAGRDMPKIDAVAKAFDTQLKNINKSKLTPREVQDLKRAAYQRIKFDFNQQKANFAEVEAKKAIVRGSRKSLEKLDPNISGINKREGDLLQLGDELEQVVGRLDNRNFFSLDTAVKIGAGTAIGPGGTVVGTAAAIAGSPRIKAKTALILHNIQKADDLGNNYTLPPEILIPLTEQADLIKQALEAEID